MVGVYVCLYYWLLGFTWNHPMGIAVASNDYVFVTDMHRLIMVSPNNLVANGGATVLVGSIRKLTFIILSPFGFL